MNKETHFEAIKEVFATIDLCIDRGIDNHQRTIGFHTSLGATEMLELFLHKKNLLSVGVHLNHTWLKFQKRIRQRYRLTFPVNMK